jgi:heterodisulfide reductase subunit A
MTHKNHEKPRVGVFLCHCGTNIGGVVNIPEVAEFVNQIDGVEFIDQNTHSCSSEGIRNIQEAIIEHNLERIVVASCTPRTHEPLFMDAVEEVNINKYLFQMVNIREHDSWVHSYDHEAATKKAKYLVQMGIEKARYLEPEEDPEIEITPACLVVGGGVAGMTAAVGVASQGFPVYLVEKESHLGGLLSYLHALLPTDQSAEKLLDRMVNEVDAEKNIKVYTSSMVESIEGFIGNFTVTINTSAESVNHTIGTIIVATGAENLKPNGYYQYGKHENIISQLELETKMRDGFEIPDIITMIQCVGSMEESGRTNCSRICCGIAIKNSTLLKKMKPDADIRVLYRQLTAYGVALEKYYQEALDLGVKFIKYVPEEPPEVNIEGGSVKLKINDLLYGEEKIYDTDLLVLSTPLVPREETKDIAKKLRVPLNSDGFLLEAHPKMRPVDFSSEGIFLAGTAHSPKNIAESITQGMAAASHALIPLRKQSLKVNAILAEVNPDICIGCGACASVCPFKAIDWGPTGFPRVNKAACKGCGLCSVECPVGAMQLKYYKDYQLIPAIQGILDSKYIQEEDPDEPVILTIACRWCSYAAADLAGIMRLKYPTNTRILLVPCSGRVDFQHIFEAFEKGADGVVVAGCLKEQCHYIDGNLVAENRVEQAKKTLKFYGIEPERLEMIFNSAGMPREFVAFMNEFTEKIIRLKRIKRDELQVFTELMITTGDD